MSDIEKIVQNRKAFYLAIDSLGQVRAEINEAGASFSQLGQKDAARKFLKLAEDMYYSLEQARELFEESHGMILAEIQEGGRLAHKHFLTESFAKTQEQNNE